LSGGRAELDPGQFNAARQITTRFYEVTAISKAIGTSTLAIDRQISDASIEAVYRQGKELELSDATIIAAGDHVATTGPIAQLETASLLLGREVRPPNGLLLVEENREIILTNRALSGRTIGEIQSQVNVETRHGVFLAAVKRMGLDLPVLDKLQLRRGDELHLIGSPMA
jgi:putative transport protein